MSGIGPVGPPRLSGVKRPVVDLAPDVVDEVDEAYQPHGCREISSNLRADELYAPSVGPAHPWKAEDIASRNTHTGHVEQSYMNPYTFEDQLRQNNRPQFDDWRKKRLAKDPAVLRTEYEAAQKKKALEEGGDDGAVVTKGGEVVVKDSEASALALVEDAEKPAGDLITLVGGKVAQGVNEEDYTEGHDLYFEENRKGERTKRVIARQPESARHVDDLYDYQGRHVMFDPPSVTKSPQNYPPKKLVHTYRGHNKGVHVVRWLPSIGHMFASGAQDGKVKLWNTFGKHEPIQTYFGHYKGIKDVNFNDDGTTFLTASFDHFIREWDTETGKVLGTYSNGSLPNCVKYHPNPDNQHQFFAGCSDKQLHQFDTRSGKIVNSYDQHLGAVYSCTFIDNGRRIVTTSEDKTIRLWEMDLPVAIKQVSDTGMQSIPTATLHPSGQYFGAQAMDNNILIYSATDKFQLKKGKQFKGHLTAGFACEVGFSADGKYVSSGNSDGELFVWAWGSMNIVKHYKCHDKVLMSHLWHPTESSKVLTCSWDGTIKLWD